MEYYHSNNSLFLKESNVLMIGSGGEMLVEEPNAFNNFVQYRHVTYASQVKTLFIIIRCIKNSKWGSRRLSDHLVTIPTSSSNNIFSFFDLFKLSIRLIKRDKIDLIVAGNAFGDALIGYFLKLITKKPLCIGMFGDYAFNEEWINENFKHRLMSKVAHFLFRKCDSIRVISPKIKKVMISELKIPEKKIFVAQVFINKKQFNVSSDVARSFRERILNRSFDYLILTIGRLVPQKDIFTLLDVAKQVIASYPSTLFIIIGDGYQKKELISYANKIGVEKNVNFVEEVTYSEIPLYFSACDIFLLTSAYEDTARVLIEAAVAGKPIVSTNTTGADSVVKNGENGYLLAVKDYPAIAISICNLLNNQDERVRFAAKSREIVKDIFNEEDLIRGVLDSWAFAVRKA